MPRKILIVDDQPVILSDLKERFEQKGFEVSTARDGLNALTHYRKEKPDIILIDAMLPKLHGFQVCKALKDKENVSIPIIIMTAVYQKASYKYEAINRYRADAYITKPLNYEYLFSEVSRLLDAREAEEDGDFAIFLQPEKEKAQTPPKQAPAETSSRPKAPPKAQESPPPAAKAAQPIQQQKRTQGNAIDELLKKTLGDILD